MQATIHAAHENECYHDHEAVCSTISGLAVSLGFMGSRGLSIKIEWNNYAVVREKWFKGGGNLDMS